MFIQHRSIHRERFSLILYVEFDVLRDFVHVDAEDEVLPREIFMNCHEGAETSAQTSLAIASSASSSANEELF